MGPGIYDKSCDVRRLLSELVILIDIVEKEDGTPPVASASIVDNSERFMLWAGNLGALRHPAKPLSLDHRLHDIHAQDVKAEIMRQLDEMADLLQTLMRLTSKASRDEATKLETAQVTQDPPEGDSFDLDLDEILALDQGSPAEEAAVAHELVSACITSLFRMGILIRKSGRRDRFTHALKGEAFPVQFDTDYVRQKYTKIHSDVFVSRLGSTIAKRRQFIKYSRDHRRRLGADDDAPEASTTATERVSSRATTFIPGAMPLHCNQDTQRTAAREEYEDDAISVKTATTTSASLTTLKLPSLQHLSPDGRIFECPICFTLGSFRSEGQWRAHAFRDLKAYVCTVGGKDCDTALFDDRASWFEHEISQHRARYRCPLCIQDLSISANSIRRHLQETHGPFSEDQLKTLQDAGRQAVAKIQAADCPFCDEWAEKLQKRKGEDLVSVEHFKRHVAVHQEQLAIFALPRGPDEDPDASVSGSDTNSAARRSEGSRLEEFEAEQDEEEVDADSEAKDTSQDAGVTSRNDKLEGRLDDERDRQKIDATFKSMQKLEERILAEIRVKTGAKMRKAKAEPDEEQAESESEIGSETRREDSELKNPQDQVLTTPTSPSIYNESPDFGDMHHGSPDFGASEFEADPDAWSPLFPPTTQEQPAAPDSPDFGGSDFKKDLDDPDAWFPLFPPTTQEQPAAPAKPGESPKSEDIEIASPTWGHQRRKSGNSPPPDPHLSVSSVNSRRRDKPLPPIIVEDPSDVIALKRARNTLAARKSRERKAQRLEELEEQIEKLTADRDYWKNLGEAARTGATLEKGKGKADPSERQAESRKLRSRQKLTRDERDIIRAACETVRREARNPELGERPKGAEVPEEPENEARRVFDPAVEQPIFSDNRDVSRPSLNIAWQAALDRANAEADARRMRQADAEEAEEPRTDNTTPETDQHKFKRSPRPRAVAESTIEEIAPDDTSAGPSSPAIATNVSLGDPGEVTPEQIRDLARRLKADPLQERRMNIFSYEPYSLPPSRGSSDEEQGKEEGEEREEPMPEVDEASGRAETTGRQEEPGGVASMLGKVATQIKQQHDAETSDEAARRTMQEAERKRQELENRLEELLISPDAPLDTARKIRSVE